jgi:hypothetical protein
MAPSVNWHLALRLPLSPTAAFLAARGFEKLYYWLGLGLGLEAGTKGIGSLSGLAESEQDYGVSAALNLGWPILC